MDPFMKTRALTCSILLKVLISLKKLTLLEVISTNRGGFLLTTHYNIKNDKVKRYRVKGLVDGVMDYTLVEAESGDVPHEAVAIAESLGIDSQWIECTKKNLNN